MENENKDQENQENENQEPEDQESFTENSPDQEQLPESVSTPDTVEEDEYEEMEQPKTPLQHAVKFGAIIGMISAIITILLYVISPALMINIWIGLSLLIIFLGLVIYGGISYRKEIGGYIDFWPAYIHGFMVLLTIGIIGLIVNLLMHNLVDTTLKETLTDASLEQTGRIMEWFGVPQDAIDDELEQQREKVEKQFTNAGMLKGLLYGIIAYAVIALITGLIVRKREKLPDVV